MKYIAIVHKDANSDYGITLPDFPGCFATAESLESIQKSIQEAVELWAEGESFEPPMAFDMEHVKNLDEAQDGMLYLVDIHFDFLEDKIVPVNISMPVYMRNRIDKMAKAKGMTRSAFLLQAVESVG